LLAHGFTVDTLADTYTIYFLVLLYRWFPAVLKTITIPARDDLCAGIVPADAVPRFCASRRKWLRADAVRRPKATHYGSGTRKIAARGGTTRLTSGIMPSSNVRTAPPFPTLLPP
jgi:hypothetical protein